MVLAKQVTAEHCHINPVRGEMSRGATEMPEQNQKNTNPATKPSNKMPLQILLFYCLSDLKKPTKNQKNPNKPMTKWEKEVLAEGGLFWKCGREQQSWSGQNGGWFDHTHTKIFNVHAWRPPFCVLLLRRISLKLGGKNTVNSILCLATVCVKGLGENWMCEHP